MRIKPSRFNLPLDRFPQKDLQLYENIITVRQRSCWKLLFSVMSVCHSVHRGDPMWPLPVMHWTSPYRDMPPAQPRPSDMFKLLQLGPQCTGNPLPSTHVRTCSLSSTYDWQAGGWYPTGMLSCDITYYILHFRDSERSKINLYHYLVTVLLKMKCMNINWQKDTRWDKQNISFVW